MSASNTIPHHAVFNHFNRVESICSGQHMYDFLGVATDVTFKKGWQKHAVSKGKTVKPPFPTANEHYFDWVALLTSVLDAHGTFRMAELGAGYGPWLTRGAFACRQCPEIDKVELLGIEADPTHFKWLNKHFIDNGISPSFHQLLHGAISSVKSKLEFPCISKPEEDYGASLQAALISSNNIKVQGHTLDELLEYFTGGPIDLLHIDAQGAEYDVIPSVLNVLKKHVRYLVIGTHISQKKHFELHELLQSNAWRSIMAFPRGEEADTQFGRIRFGDGFQFWKNPKFS